MAGGFNLLNSPNNITLMRTSYPLSFNAAYPTVPPNGIKEVSNANGVSVYPNPFSNEIAVKVNASLSHSKFTISNAIGRIVLNGNLEGVRTILDLDKLASGFYTLNIAGQSGIKITKK